MFAFIENFTLISSLTMKSVKMSKCWPTRSEMVVPIPVVIRMLTTMKRIKCGKLFSVLYFFFLYFFLSFNAFFPSFFNCTPLVSAFVYAYRCCHISPDSANGRRTDGKNAKYVYPVEKVVSVAMKVVAEGIRSA